MIVGRVLILLVNLLEARRLAARLGDGLLAIGLGLLQNARGRAARFRHDAIGVGFGLVAETLQILLRGGHVAEGGDDLLRADRPTATAPAAPARRL